MRMRPRLLLVDRLIARAVLGSVGITWLVLAGFDTFMAFAGEAGSIGHGDYGLAKAVSYVLLTVPRRAYEAYAYAALIGGLLGLGGLAASGELTALRAAGMSRLRTSLSAVFVLAVLMAVVVVMGETLAPWGEQRAQAVQLAAKSSDVSLARGGRVWARDAGKFITARSGRAVQSGRTRQVELSEVRVFEFDPQGRLNALSTAETARYANDRWTLRDVRRTEFGDASASTETSERSDWQSGLDAHLLTLSIVRPNYLSMRDLKRNVEHLERNEQNASAYSSIIWRRIFYPVNVLVLALCALPFAFGALRSGGLGKRLFIGIVLAIGFYFLQRSIVSFGALRDLPPLLVNMVPPALVIVLALAYFRREA